jgi:hypothetical protein
MHTLFREVEVVARCFDNIDDLHELEAAKLVGRFRAQDARPLRSRWRSPAPRQRDDDGDGISETREAVKRVVGTDDDERGDFGERVWRDDVPLAVLPGARVERERSNAGVNVRLGNGSTLLSFDPEEHEVETRDDAVHIYAKRRGRGRAHDRAFAVATGASGATEVARQHDFAEAIRRHYAGKVL